LPKNLAVSRKSVTVHPAITRFRLLCRKAESFCS
jgi:hypothetical protein